MSILLGFNSCALTLLRYFTLSINHNRVFDLYLISSTSKVTRMIGWEFGWTTRVKLFTLKVHRN